MLTIKLVYELSDVADDLKWATNTHMTPFTLTFKAQLTISMVLEDLFCSFILPVHPYFCPSIFVFTHPNDRWTDGSLHKAMSLADYLLLRSFS